MDRADGRVLREGKGELRIPETDGVENSHLATRPGARVPYDEYARN